MKITIELWQSSFNGEWNCDISSGENSFEETQHWAVEDFCALLNLISERFPKAKCISKDKE